MAWLRVDYRRRRGFYDSGVVLGLGRSGVRAATDAAAPDGAGDPAARARIDALEAQL